MTILRDLMESTLYLCSMADAPEADLIKELKVKLAKNRKVLRAKYDYGLMPIHLAAMHRTLAFG